MRVYGVESLLGLALSFKKLLLAVSYGKTIVSYVL